MRYTGLTKCKLDNAGRIKLPPKVIQDLQEDGHGSTVVMHYLPEGCLGLYTPATWDIMGSKAEEEKPNLLGSLDLRRSSRRNNAYTDETEITQQGRITIPPMIRDKLDMKEGEDIVINGCGHGYELWNQERWAIEEQYL